MFDFMALGLGLVLGAVIAGLGAFGYLGRKSARDSEALERVETENKKLQEQLEQCARAELEVVKLQTQLEEQQKQAVDVQNRMNETFAKISLETVNQNSKNFLQIAETSFAPLKSEYDKAQKLMHELETKRVGAYAELKEATKNIIEVNRDLKSETSKLETALRRPDHRGKWGEIGLRNVVEFAGMTQYCDFVEQTTTEGEQNLRPDMIVTLPGNGHIVIDSKLPLEHYLNAIDHPEQASDYLEKHLKSVELHVRTLSNKEYWNQFENTPNFVVMFVNVESALIAALERNPDLHEKAMKSNVLLTSPATLVALLQAAAYGWRQEGIAKNAEEIAKAGTDLFDRLSVFREHLEKVGIKIQQAAGAFNKARGSFNSRLTPGAKTLSDLDASDGKELPDLDTIDQEILEHEEV